MWKRAKLKAKLEGKNIRGRGQNTGQNVNLSEIIHELLKLSDPYFHFSSLRREMLVNGTGWKKLKIYKNTSDGL